MDTKTSVHDVERQLGSTANVPKQEWKADYRSLRDFRAFEFVNALRLPVTLDGFKAITTVGSFAVLVVGTLLLFSILSVLRDGPLREDTEAVLNWGFLGLLYAGTAITLGDIISSRRLSVSGCPHVELFRALDLPFHQVVIRYGLVPVFRRIGLLAYSWAWFLVVFFEQSVTFARLAAASIAVLIFVSSACFYAVVHFASVPVRRVGLHWKYCLIALVFGVILGIVTGFLAPLIGPLDGRDLEGMSFLPWLTVFALLAAGLLLALGVRGWRRLSYLRISLPASSKGPAARRGKPGLARFVVTDMVSSKQGTVVSTIVLAWLAVVGILLGARAILPLHSTLGEAELARSFLGISVLLSLAVTEPTLQRIGPTAKLYHYRFAWENGSSATAIAAKLLGTYILLSAVIGSFIFWAAYLALGVLAPGAVLASVIVAAAGVVAESMSSPSATTDGTKSNDVMDAVLTLLLVSPCSFTLIVSPGFSTFVLLGYSAFLTLGAAVCLRQRLLSLRSRLTL
ncbi:MAG TPA: hypothetical protein VJQ60_05430 [Arthrobacter sp.]|nr:hypothetical protein [Arthrobacter sp.]